MFPCHAIWWYTNSHLHLRDNFPELTIGIKHELYDPSISFAYFSCIIKLVARIFGMDKNCFLSFRKDLAKLKEMVKNKTSEEVEFVFSKLVEACPELSKFEEQLPDFIQRQKKTPRKDCVDDVRQKLVDSIKSKRSCYYTDVKLVLDNEQICVETWHHPNKVVDDARKRNYFSCLEGQVLKRNHRQKDQSDIEIDWLFTVICLFFDLSWWFGCKI